MKMPRSIAFLPVLLYDKVIRSTKSALFETDCQGAGGVHMGERRGKYPTIKDVARLANTSTATVSYVLSGNTDRLISLELRDRVLDAAEELHYTKSARGLQPAGKPAGA